MPPSNRGDTEESPWVDQTSTETFALVADDVSMNATVLSRMLGRLGVCSAVVCNGAEAVVFIQAHKIDMEFMDCKCR